MLLVLRCLVRRRPLRRCGGRSFIVGLIGNVWVCLSVLLLFRGLLCRLLVLRFTCFRCDRLLLMFLLLRSVVRPVLMWISWWVVLM